MIERDGWKDANAFSFSLDMNFLVCFWTEIVYVIKWWKRHRIWITIFFFFSCCCSFIFSQYIGSLITKSINMDYPTDFGSFFSELFARERKEERRKKNTFLSKCHPSFIPFNFSLSLWLALIAKLKRNDEWERMKKNNHFKPNDNATMQKVYFTCMLWDTKVADVDDLSSAIDLPLSLSFFASITWIFFHFLLFIIFYWRYNIICPLFAFWYVICVNAWYFCELFVLMWSLGELPCDESFSKRFLSIFCLFQHFEMKCGL